MIGAMKEYFVDRIETKDGEFWSYYIVHENDAGKPRRYNIIRINSTCKKNRSFGSRNSIETKQKNN